MSGVGTPRAFAEKIAECLALKPEQIDDLFLIDEDKEGYFVATLYPKKFLDKNQFKLVCGLVKDLGGEAYLQGAKTWKIPGPLAKKSPTTASTAVPTTVHTASPTALVKISQSSELCIGALSEDEDIQALRGSSRKIGSLYPVLVSPNGDVIDGFHRLKADPNWPKFTVEGVVDRLQLARARLIANERRNVSPAEKAELLREIYAYSKWSPKQIAEELGWSIRTVYQYLPSDLKGDEPKELSRARLARGMEETVSSATVKPQDVTVGKAQELLDTPAGREVLADAVKEAVAKGEVPSSDDEEPLFAEGIKTVDEEPDEGSEKTDVSSPQPLHDGEHPQRLQGVQVGEFECSECHQHFFIDHITSEKHRLTKVRSVSE